MRKKGGPLAFFDEASSSATANVAVAQRRSNAVKNFILVSLSTFTIDQFVGKMEKGCFNTA
jgi:hypothetical protein